MPGLDVSGYLDDGALTLEGVVSARYPEGHAYKVASLSWPDTLRLRRLVAKWGGNVPDREVLTAEDAADLSALVTREDGSECTLAERLLGDALTAMVDDGVPPINVDRLVTVVTIHFGTNEQVAQQFVAAAAGEARARENRAAPTANKPAPRASAAKRSSSPTKAGSKSSRASGAANTRAGQASTPGRATSAPAKAAARRAAS